MADAAMYAMVGVDWARKSSAPRVTDTRSTHRIPAREVVPGMILCACEYRWPVRAAGVHSDGARWIDVDRGDYESRRYGFCAHEMVDVKLCGPSPRRLLCTCLVPSETATGYVEAVPPHEHAADCPVAPVPGEHGGMRLWPAPFKGAAWGWARHSQVWIVPHGPAVSVHCLLEDLPAGRVAPCTADVLWHCFYLPPEPQPERREPTPWAPHAGYEGLAVKYG